MIYLDGLYLKHYMGIGASEQKMAPFKKFNFFIGANNSGKSIPLNFISKYFLLISAPLYGENRQPQPTALERHMGSTGGAIEFGIPISVESFASRIRNKGHNYNPIQLKTLLDRLIARIAEGNYVWLRSRIPFDKFDYQINTTPTNFGGVMDPQQWQYLWSGITGQSGGGLHQNWISETLNYMLSSQSISTPSTILIPAIRQIGPAGQGDLQNDGSGLIDKLAELQSPDHDRRSDRLLFDHINRFLQTVTDTADARIEIPHNRVHVLVEMNSRVLPLASLGTGIHEVIMLAAACTINQNKIVCVEEPEIHLHPILQRKFMRYLDAYTSNQYFIAIHSPAFIDTPGAAIFHVSHDKSKTVIKESILKRDRYAICVDLGHRASDIVQSNAVVWVEGPSERIYLRHWISAAAEDLVEGMHYSIMFYGGRLLSHLSADDEDVQSFIDLRYLNQNIAVVMDSDKTEEKSAINPTKQRVIDEFAGKRGVAWLTAGREIENYIRYELIQEGLADVHSELYHCADQNGQYDHAFYFRMSETRPQKSGPPTYVYKGADKVKLARWVCNKPADLDVLDLRERLDEVIAMIRAAND